MYYESRCYAAARQIIDELVDAKIDPSVILLTMLAEAGPNLAGKLVAKEDRLADRDFDDILSSALYTLGGVPAHRTLVRVAARLNVPLGLLTVSPPR